MPRNSATCSGCRFGVTSTASRSGGEWDQEAVDAILSASAEAFARIDRCLDAPDFVFPAANSLNDSLPTLYPSILARAGRLLELRAASRLRKHDTDGAVDDVLRVVRFAQRFQDGQGAVFPWAVSESIKCWGVGLLESIARRGTPSRDLCVEIARDLPRYEARGLAAQTALREEYRLFSADLDDPELVGLYLKWELGSSFGHRLVQKNRTRHLLLNTVRPLIELHGRPFRGEPVVEQELRPSGWLNYYGEVLWATVASTIVRGVDYRYRANFQVRATSALFALRAHHLDHGYIPDRLSALVPDYLDAVPRDPWNGKPLRYSAARRLIWAVGDDLVDDGGFEEKGDDPTDDENEPTLHIPRW